MRIGRKTQETLLEFARGRGVSPYAALPSYAREKRGAAGGRLKAFSDLIDGLRALAASADAVTTVLRTLEATGYLKQYESSDAVEDQSRKENVQELVSAVTAYCDARPEATLADYLDEVSLRADIDELDAGEDALALMTVHSAKGLEFDAVFVAGLEERLFPHANARQPRDVEEERRLCYVAMTRARQRLFLSYAETRRRFGAIEAFPPSRFLKELPSEVLDTPAVPVPAAAAPDADMGWDVEPFDDFDQRPRPSSFDEAVGRRVRHPAFGVGRVCGGWGGRAQVEFPEVGRKTIAVRFLELLD